MVRSILRQVVGFDPCNRLRRSFLQKPYLPDCDVHFNLSNSRKAVAVVVARGHQCGVDIEPLHPSGNLKDVATAFMSASEYQNLASKRTSHDRSWFFVEAWSRKEAFLKALGVGLAFPPDKVEFFPSGRSTQDLWYSETTGLTVRTFRMLGHALSVCLHDEQMPTLRLYQLNPDCLEVDTAIETRPASVKHTGIHILDQSFPFPSQGVRQ
ncbi:4'-phosphopantetheinyl transferase family protein [Yoonia sp. GPGPB17]|uniref:4'-phosphopantetheinyl transferase family protein n=1 Tax=Yoonia sp. GPGPB17 TaxID=3026147 RepID=UPI0040409D04